jgi:ribonucleotide monophosphatase NagD (HAD superfamily)
MDIRQIVQSHTPLRESLREKYENEAILVIGGRGQSGRAVAESYVLIVCFTSSSALS